MDRGGAIQQSNEKEGKNQRNREREQEGGNMLRKIKERGKKRQIGLQVDHFTWLLRHSHNHHIATDSAAKTHTCTHAHRPSINQS
jgi:hypothetical protein